MNIISNVPPHHHTTTTPHHTTPHHVSTSGCVPVGTTPPQKADKKFLKDFGKEYTGKTAPGKLYIQCHKDALAKSGKHHHHKRAYLKFEMTNLWNLLQDSPGLLGPKFPMVVCLLSMARAEIMWFARHDAQESIKKRYRLFPEPRNPPPETLNPETLNPEPRTLALNPELRTPEP